MVTNMHWKFRQTAPSWFRKPKGSRKSAGSGGGLHSSTCRLSISQSQEIKRTLPSLFSWQGLPRSSCSWQASPSSGQNDPGLHLSGNFSPLRYPNGKSSFLQPLGSQWFVLGLQKKVSPQSVVNWKVPTCSWEFATEHELSSFLLVEAVKAKGIKVKIKNVNGNIRITA